MRHPISSRVFVTKLFYICPGSTPRSPTAQRVSYGAAEFLAPTDFPVGLETNYVAVGDFNGDGLQDLAVTSESDVVSILLGDGTGSFDSPIDFPLNRQLGGIGVDDFNGDGLQDLAVANGASHNLSVLLRDCSTE